MFASAQAEAMAEAVKSLSASNMESVRPAQVLASLQKLRSQVLQHRLEAENEEGANSKAVDEIGPNSAVYRAWKAYETILENRGVLDFDLLLIRTIRLLDDHPKVSNHIVWCQFWLCYA
jgi:superfamily I DNA/RNA helicase